MIEARLSEEAAQTGGLHDAYLDDVEIRTLETTGSDAYCAWVESPRMAMLLHSRTLIILIPPKSLFDKLICVTI